MSPRASIDPLHLATRQRRANEAVGRGEARDKDLRLADAALSPDDPDEQRQAARCAARWLMARAHGCEGAGCAHERHDADAESLREVLAILGAPSQTQVDGWGQRVKDSRLKPGAPAP